MPTTTKKATKKRDYTEYVSCEQDSLEEVPFCIQAILKEETPENRFHDFVWKICVVLDENQKVFFCLNPSYKRNETIEEYCKHLPVHSKTLEKKSFEDKRQRKTITYYEIVDTSLDWICPCGAS